MVAIPPTYLEEMIVMKRTVFFAFLLGFVLFGCKQDPDEQTILKGHARIIVDEEVFPIVEDAYWVFKTQYPAELTLDSLPESEGVNALLSGKADIAILTRKLTKKEEGKFRSEGIKPRITPFAKDAVVFLTNVSSRDTVINLSDVISFLRGESSPIKKLVFENPNSGSVRLLDSLAGLNKSPKKNVYSLDSHESVLKYIAENENVIAVTALNPILQPYEKWEPYMKKVKVMGVRNVKSAKKDDTYYKPNQTNLALGTYPLVRTLYLLNYQGKAGLGTGFASYLAGQDGQRIVLKSGLLPERTPSRIINIRKEINTTK